MKKYIELLRTERTPHERREFALRVATVFTALLFVAWLANLGVRVAEQNKNVAQNNTQSTASTLIAVQEASTTTGY